MGTVWIYIGSFITGGSSVRTDQLWRTVYDTGGIGAGEGTRGNPGFHPAYADLYDAEAAGIYTAGKSQKNEERGEYKEWEMRESSWKQDPEYHADSSDVCC